MIFRNWNSLETTGKSAADVKNKFLLNEDVDTHQHMAQLKLTTKQQIF
jgi:hypothetical protein